MIDELKQRFDYLIIDSAPIGPVSDSLLLKIMLITTIFVVGIMILQKCI
jgi:Mrp family chromosome partitioning ATPase